MTPAELDFRFLRVTVDGTVHVPILTPDGVERFRATTGEEPFDKVEGRDVLRLKVQHAPAMLHSLCGGEDAVGMPRAAWDEAFMELAPDQVLAFTVRAILREPLMPERQGSVN